MTRHIRTAFIPAIFFLFPILCFAQTGQKGKSATDKPDVIKIRKAEDPVPKEDPLEELLEFSDEEPFFPNYKEYISKNLRYPSKALIDSTQGSVVANFVVEKNGKLSDIRIKKSLSPECDAEAIRLLSTMPPWTPGKTDGISVRVAYSVTIRFSLKP